MKGELLRNIVLAGGSTLFDGMAGRIASEVKSRCTIAHTGDVPGSRGPRRVGVGRRGHARVDPDL